MIADHRTSSVVLLEFNELTPSLMERFIAEGCLPNFKALHDESEIYATEAGEKYPYLEPWIQWVTVHSGLNYDQHGVFHLDHGRDLARPCVWDLLSERNLRVWLCDSMNVSYRAPINGYVLPDPWSSNIPPFPESLAPYHRFIQAHVQEYTNDRVPLRPTDYLKFLAFMVRHGLSPSTVAAIVEQLASERTGRYRWRRAAIMDRLQFDLFRAIYRRDRPHFSTFFLKQHSSSAAHVLAQHGARGVHPEAAADEQRELAHAIRFGCESMDRLRRRVSSARRRRRDDHLLHRLEPAAVRHVRRAGRQGSASATLL